MTSSGVQAFTRTVTARLSRHVVAVPPVKPFGPLDALVTCGLSGLKESN